MRVIALTFVFPMPKFGDALRKVIDAKKLTGIALSEKSGLTRPYVSGLLTGTRKVGPKTLAAVMLAVEDERHQTSLLTAFLDEEVDEVYSFLGGKGAVQRQRHLFTKALFASALPAQPDQQNKDLLNLPVWLEELVVEAVQAGDSDPQVLELIRDLLAAALKHRASPSRKPKVSR